MNKCDCAQNAARRQWDQTQHAVFCDCKWWADCIYIVFFQSFDHTKGLYSMTALTYPHMQSYTNGLGFNAKCQLLITKHTHPHNHSHSLTQTGTHWWKHYKKENTSICRLKEWWNTDLPIRWPSLPPEQYIPSLSKHKTSCLISIWYNIMEISCLVFLPAK